MKILTLKTFVRGTAAGMIVGNADDVLDLPDDLAAELIEGGYVQPRDATETLGLAEDAPIEALLDLKAADIIAALPALSLADVQALTGAETAGKARKGVLSALADAAALKVDEADYDEARAEINAESQANAIANLKALSDGIADGEITGVSEATAALIDEPPVE